MLINAYLNFDGRCEEAIEFYRRALGAEVLMQMRFKDQPGGGQASADHPAPPADKIMHASLKIGETTVLASDGRCGGNTAFQGFSLTITARDAGEAERLFKALADGGQVVMPLGPTFFSPCFGMVTDRFGLVWMLIVRQ